jgi:hypothetical protein
MLQLTWRLPTVPCPLRKLIPTILTPTKAQMIQEKAMVIDTAKALTSSICSKTSLVVVAGVGAKVVVDMAMAEAEAIARVAIVIQIELLSSTDQNLSVKSLVH